MNAILHDPTLHRLGLTLAHALWEDALIGLAAWAGLALLRREDARLRYRWACAGLGTMVLAPAATFLALAQGAGAPATVRAADLTVWASVAPGGAGLAATRLDAFLPWLALLWATGAGLMLLRLGGGLWWLDRVYLRQSRPAPAAWEARLRSLGRRMGIFRPVRLLLSDRAQSPLALGWLRPTVLLPASALLALTPESLEAVLAHELAHLRRSDYLANLLQTLAEALLFFHPAAWWLSRQIREVREHCCDDEAAAILGDPLPLAEGLAALAALRRLPADPEPALAAARGTLMHRITRLFHAHPSEAPALRGLALLLTLAALSGATALAAHQARSTGSAPIQDVDLNKVQVTYRPPTPAYPAEAKAKGITGTVVVEVVTAADGRVDAARAVEGPEALRPTAVAFAQGWRFAPARQDGKPVRARFRLTMPFRLAGGEAPVRDLDFRQVKVAHKPEAPAYPAEAKAKGISGTVIVVVTIGTDGRVQSAKAVEGPDELRSTAEDYARSWRFEPARVDGKPVAARFRLTMPFRLH